jgi:hypothetical protein
LEEEEAVVVAQEELPDQIPTFITAQAEAEEEAAEF